MDYWGPKLEANRLRDMRNIEQLAALGWAVETVWQCELKEPEKLLDQLRTFLAKS